MSCPHDRIALAFLVGFALGPLVTLTYTWPAIAKKQGERDPVLFDLPLYGMLVGSGIVWGTAAAILTYLNDKAETRMTLFTRSIVAAVIGALLMASVGNLGLDLPIVLYDMSEESRHIVFLVAPVIYVIGFGFAIEYCLQTLGLHQVL